MNRWDERYKDGTTPWDTGSPDDSFVRAVKDGRLPGGRALEIGCGTGTNARFFAEHGWDVTAVDLSPRAIAAARALEGGVRYAVADVFAAPLPDGPYDLVFDRGCFHTFHEAEERAAFARRVAEALRPGGMWMSLIGSTEGPPRDMGPPRRTACQIVEAVEPELEIVALEAGRFSLDIAPTAWVLRARRREIPAQPSSVPRP